MVAGRLSGAGAQTRTTLKQALSLHQRGNLDEAERLYAEILARDPGLFDALHNLGLVRFQRGDVEGSIAWFRRAIDSSPGSAEARTSLANALLAQGRTDEALAGYENALALDLAHAEAHYGRGAALCVLGQIEDAIAAYEAAVDTDPGYAEAHYRLATALQALQHHDRAVSSYKAALDVDPDYAEANYGLATTLQELNRHADAIAFYQKALAAKPDYALAHFGLASALQALDRHGQAIRGYETAIALEPGLAMAHNNLGTAFLELGRLEEARRSYQKAIDLQPRKPWFYRNLISLDRVAAGDRHFAALQALADSMGSMSAGEQVHLHFALGKAFADIGDHQRSFAHFLEGNALKRRELVYDGAATALVFKRIQSTFTAALMRAQAGRGDPSGLPIFILGMPRSGSTLIEQILASHPQVFGGGERLDLSAVVEGIGGPLPFPELFAVATDDQLRRLAAAYLDRIKAAADFVPNSGLRHITDKMPGNFVMVGVIKMALPNARIIHSRRDPVDTCLSCFSTLFQSAAQCFTYDLGELGRYYRAYDELMRHWCDVLPPGAMLDVQYEKLVTDFEMQARRILAYCGLEWDDACLAFNKTERPVKTASMAQVRQPVYRSSVGRWRPGEALLRPLLDGLGNDLAGGVTLGGDPKG
jgi:tetratricopeptide (TPR) repeat protein